jgi:hypothetical protein
MPLDERDAGYLWDMLDSARTVRAFVDFSNVDCGHLLPLWIDQTTLIRPEDWGKAKRQHARRSPH